MFDFLADKFSSLFARISGQHTLTQADIQNVLDTMRDALLEADVPYEIVETLLAQVTQEVIGQKVLASLKPSDLFIKIIHQKMLAVLGGAPASVPFSFQLPATVMMMGLQGSGKTTSIAKLAYYVLEQARARGKKRSILVASVDFYRPAAVDQLEVLAGQVGISFYRSPFTEPVRAAQDILDYYRRQQYELLFLDTAGRMHVDTDMMEELKRIAALVTPTYKILVLDAMTGQESLNVARSFDQAVGFGYGIMSKMDSKSRGGAAFAFRQAAHKPLIFIGTGEKVADLEPFRAERMASRIIGMGDVLSLIEKADRSIKQEEQAQLARSLGHGSMTLQDFADQMAMVGKLGSLASLSKYIPGLAGKVSEEALAQGELDLKRYKAIIGSMTARERYYPRILDTARKQRIAQGSGTSLADVNALLTRFEQAKHFVKLWKHQKQSPFFK